jgi:hypothetical protein
VTEDLPAVSAGGSVKSSSSQRWVWLPSACTQVPAATPSTVTAADW